MGNEFSDDEFRDIINDTFSKKSRDERKNILRKALESDSETSRRFSEEFDEARDKSDFSKIRNELKSQEAFIEFGTPINPSTQGGKFLTAKSSKRFAKGGFRGTVDTKTLLTVGEGGKKEFVSVKKNKNGFDMMNFDMNPMPPKLRKKSKPHNDFDFMGGF